MLFSTPVFSIVIKLLIQAYRRNIFLAATLGLLLTSCASKHLNPTNEIPRIGKGNTLIQVPSDIRVLTANGRDMQAPSLIAGHYELAIGEGEQQLIVQYEANWNEADEAGYYIRWSPVVFQFEFKADQSYRIDFQRFSDRDQVMEAVTTPNVWLENSEGQLLLKGTRVQKQTQASIYVPLKRDSEAADYLGQLQAVWKLATDEEKAAFAKWIETVD